VSTPVTTVAALPKPAKPVTHRVLIKTKQRLVASKLQAGDVGIGWTAAAKQTSSHKPQHFCNRDLAGLKPYARTDTVFERKGGGGIVTESMSAYPIAQAHRLVQEFRSLLGTCSKWTRAEGGVPTTYTLSRIDFPAVGDESAAARIDTSFTFKQRPVTITSDFVMMRVGNVVIYLARTAPAGQQPSTAALASLAQIAANRLAAV